MIEQLFAKNYGCLKDVTTPKMGMLHTFIGPNDSGKSTLLRAVRLLTYCANINVLENVLEETFDLRARPEPQWLAGHTPGGDYQVMFAGGGLHEASWAIEQARPSPEMPIRSWGSRPEASVGVREQLRWARLLRLDPDALRMRSSLIPDGGPVDFMDDRGRGLPGVYDSIVNRGDDSFAQIRSGVTKLFPSVKNLRLKAVSQSEKVIEVELKDGARVPASQMSEGLLYFLAFAALPFLSPTSLVLVEEPENGLHPARIGKVMMVLREFSQSGTQILLATHSPLVVNELRGDEVTVVTRDEDGTKLVLMQDTPDFEGRSKVYALGELWVSYADGGDEGPLLNDAEEE